MRCVSCLLLSPSIISNSIGVQEEVLSTKEIPIIKVEDIYANEFYEANELGFKPELRLRISVYNYDGQQELSYGGTVYTIIRTQEVKADELILICERKVKNIKEIR